jgi:hypothetical protein
VGLICTPTLNRLLVYRARAGTGSYFCQPSQNYHTMRTKPLRGRQLTACPANRVPVRGDLWLTTWGSVAIIGFALVPGRFSRLALVVDAGLNEADCGRLALGSRKTGPRASRNARSDEMLLPPRTAGSMSTTARHPPARSLAITGSPGAHAGCVAHAGNLRSHSVCPSRTALTPTCVPVNGPGLSRPPARLGVMSLPDVVDLLTSWGLVVARA